MRPQVVQRTLIGVEVTPGTAVSTAKRLLCTSVMLNPDEPVDPYRPVGMKIPTTATLQKGFATGSYEGVACYNDIVYILSSLLETATGTWNFKPSSDEVDTVKTFSMLTGGSAGAEKIAYGIFNSLRMRMSKTEVSVNGDVFGRIIDEAPAVPAITDVIAMPINPKDIDIAVGPDDTSLVVLGSCLEAELAIAGMFGQKFTLKRSQPSFDASVPLAPEANLNIVLEHDSESKEYMADLRAQERGVFQIHAVGPVIGAGPGTYEFTLTCPFMWRNPRDAGDNQGLHARSYDLQPIHDSTFGGWIEVDIVNEVSAL